MEYERKCITLTWHLDTNIKFTSALDEGLYSPVMSVDVLDGTKWRLGLQGLSSAVSITINRVEDNGPDEIELYYEFIVTMPYTILSTSIKTNSHKFRKFDKCSDVLKDIFKEHFFRSKSVKIQCRLYKVRGPISQPINCFAPTRMSSRCWIFQGVAENFSNLSSSDKRTFKIKTAKDETFLTIDLVLAPTIRYNSHISKRKAVTALAIFITPRENADEQLYHLKVFILDSNREKTDIGKVDKEFSFRNSASFHLPDVTKEYLLNNADAYLPNNTLTVHCEVSFLSGILRREIEGHEGGQDSESFCDVVNEIKLLMSKKGIPWDADLHTDSGTYPANIAILRAQSPLFVEILNNKIRNGIPNWVYIGNPDPLTVKRLLVFFFSGTLREAEWKDAVKLYILTSKFQFISLREKCSAFLKQSIGLCNVCVLLDLANTYGDEDLKEAGRNYIVTNYPKILHCSQWRDIQKNLPQVAIEVLRSVVFESSRLCD